MKTICQFEQKLYLFILLLFLLLFQIALVYTFFSPFFSGTGIFFILYFCVMRIVIEKKFIAYKWTIEDA